MADAKPAVERLSEDEALRGDLSDIGFGPLFDWAVAAVEKFAPQAANSDALDAYTSRVRGVVQSAVQAAQDSKLDDINALLDFDPADKEKVTTALNAVTFGDDPDENAVQLAAALQSAAPAVSSQEPIQPASTDNTPAPEEPKQEAAQPPNQELPQQKAAQPPEPEPAPEAVAPTESTSINESVPNQEAAQPPQVQKKNEEGASESPQQEAAQPPPAAPNLNPDHSNQNLPVHAESTATNASTPNQNAAPPPTSNPPPAFLDTLRSRVGQAANSAWGLFKGFNRRRSG